MARTNAVNRLRNAAAQLDNEQFDLLRLAEEFDINFRGHQMRSQRETLLRQARNYVVALRRLARVKL